MINCDMSHDIYASSAWWGFASASDLQRLEAFIRRSDRYGFIPANLATFADLRQNAYKNLFDASCVTLPPSLSVSTVSSSQHFDLYDNVHTASSSPLELAISRQWRSNRVCNAHGPSAVDRVQNLSDVVFSSKVDCIIR